MSSSSFSIIAVSSAPNRTKIDFYYHQLCHQSNFRISISLFLDSIKQFSNIPLHFVLVLKSGASPQYPNFLSAMYFVFAELSARYRQSEDRWHHSSPDGWSRNRKRLPTLFNREVKLLWSFIVAKWTASKRFDVTMVHPIKRSHVKIAASARYSDCLYVRSGCLHVNTHTHGHAHIHKWADSLLEFVIYPPSTWFYLHPFGPPSFCGPPLSNRLVISLSSNPA